MRIAGSRALVTGASSGIGAAVARRLAVAGAELVVIGRDPQRLGAVAARYRGRAVVADLGTELGLREACAVAGEVDLVVASAGQGWAGRFAHMPVELLGELVAVNLVAPQRLARTALPGMLLRGRGHLVFLASIAAVGVREEAVYAATKAGLRAFAAGLRDELDADPVGVTTVLPGAADTPFFARRGRPYERRVPRAVSADTVAAAALAAVEHNRAEVFVPRWLTVPARINGGLPSTFHRLARRFG